LSKELRQNCAIAKQGKAVVHICLLGIGAWVNFNVALDRKSLKPGCEACLAGSSYPYGFLRRKENINCVLFHGGMSGPARNDALRKFESGNVQVLLLSLKVRQRHSGETGPSSGFSSRGGHIFKMLYWMHAATRGPSVKWGSPSTTAPPRWRRPCGESGK